MDRRPKKICLYARLSEEDEKLGESNSITNQRSILTKYADENRLTPYEFIFDDGFSGGPNQKRPAFTKMIDEVEAGLVSTVIVKDMSRFGRDYLYVGMLTEILFPKMEVRLIAIHDNVDSERGENDFMPIMNMFNEWHVKTTSKKIRAVFQAKAASGQRVSGIPIYGYCNDPENRKQLIIDEEAAAVVRSIFQMSVDGLGPCQIARVLNTKRLLCPNAYKLERGILAKPRPTGSDPYFWRSQTVAGILSAQEYLGRTVNLKTWTRSYKDKQRYFNPEEKWLVFEGTHPPIIDEATWEIVQRMRQHKRRPPRYGETILFSGTAYCADCKKKLYYRRRAVKGGFAGGYVCATYNAEQNKPDCGCTCHFIHERILTQIVLNRLKSLLDYAARHEDELTRAIWEKTQAEQKRELAAQKRTIQKHRRRLSELDTLFERVYEDNVVGKLSDERFHNMSIKYEQEQVTLRQELVTLEAKLAADEGRAGDADRFIAAIRRCPDIQELTPAIIHEFIERIIVHEANGERGRNRTQRVEIIWNGIGAFETE